MERKRKVAGGEGVEGGVRIAEVTSQEGAVGVNPNVTNPNVTNQKTNMKGAGV